MRTFARGTIHARIIVLASHEGLRGLRVPPSSKEGAERRSALDACASEIRANDAGPQARARRLASRWDARLSALHFGNFWLSDPGQTRCLAARLFAWRPSTCALSSHSGIRSPPGAGYEPAAQDAGPAPPSGTSPEDALSERDHRKIISSRRVSKIFAAVPGKPMHSLAIGAAPHRNCPVRSITHVADAIPNIMPRPT